MLRAFKKRQAGVTLFEVLLVLFVAAFIAAAVATIYSKVTLTFKQNQLQTGVQQLAANISAAYTSSAGADYSSLDVPTIITAGLVPDDMHVGPDAVNPWVNKDGWEVKQNGSTKNEYIITLNEIPVAACSSLFPSLSKISTASPIQINGSASQSTGEALANCPKNDPATIILTVN